MTPEERIELLYHEAIQYSEELGVDPLHVAEHAPNYVVGISLSRATFSNMGGMYHKPGAKFVFVTIYADEFFELIQKGVLAQDGSGCVCIADRDLSFIFPILIDETVDYGKARLKVI